MSVRLSEVAHHAGVSEATVSRVLNDRPGVAQATREAVLTSVDVLGYDRPSALRQQMVGTVGLIVPELTNPIFPLFAQTIQMSLAASGYTAVLCTQAPGGVHEDDYLHMLLDRGVAGVIFVSGQHANLDVGVERYVQLRSRGLPIVLLNGHRDEIDAPSLSNDEAGAVELAVSHLISLGHQRIGLATGQHRYVPVVRKVEAFRRLATERLGVADPGQLVAETWFSVEGGVLAARALLARDVTAIVCGSDLMALGVVRAARQAGLRVPDDLSVVGYDGSLISGFTDPPLTTVRQDVGAMCEAAVRALVDEIGGRPHPRGDALYAPELVVRGSTARAPR
ncbi:LacI family DNA-binding transcriptional regulator [Luteipulveratus flavus]|uniref:LacI family DNA-binding transcriptional regulator n=1 Tax=Luteipulveratus flavus TaxID=3031728 RepID=A0ABT6CE95_9MICO|nr:LacI family DNA-binding transcriptional regulator [Luteipulveratus sp. YIM 133296]MDF8266364.1 LacI family DNA-binding transcriptional regulator [Luteipulveratus sp. YIM 133296]